LAHRIFTYFNVLRKHNQEVLRNVRESQPAGIVIGVYAQKEKARLKAALLRSANSSAPSGCVEDFHIEVAEHARHTKKKCSGYKSRHA